MSRGTRIGLSLLEAIERDDFESFSQRGFVLGFLRGYARYLGIDAEEVIRRYRFQEDGASRKETFQQMPLFPDPHRAEEQIPESRKDSPGPPFRKEGKGSRRKVLVQLIILGAAVGLSLYIHHLLENSKDIEKIGPTKWTPTEKNQDQGTGTHSYVAQSSGKGKVIGNRLSKHYYLPGMRDYQKVETAHRVDFESEEEAVESGYQKAPQ